MDPISFAWLGFAGTCLAMTAIILAPFWTTDTGFSTDFRQNLSAQLLRRKASDNPVPWSAVLVSAFDRTFGARAFGLRRVAVCVAATALTYGLIALVVWSTSAVPDHGTYFVTLFWVFLTVGLTCNLAADFVSVAQTRYILGLIDRHHERKYVVMVLFVLDFVLSNAIIVLVALGVGASLPLLRTLGLFDVLDQIMADLAIALDVFSGDNDVYVFHTAHNIGARGASVVALYVSTLFASLWIWLSALGWLLIRLAARAGDLLDRLLAVLPVRTHPMRAIGQAAAMFFGLLFLATGLLGIEFGVDADTLRQLPL